ncbi:hypothetical protein NUW58_g2024 [Xylaria curta]|uniref:Uncharacterized protein n=1 Tax=Xylaria curta TaxID=42375 RepID=A0ACC1PK44_9PEZI|nr:hypothetical protein NUW58_g2024 [Xylaria curta]
MSCFNIPQGENAALEPIAICGMCGIKSPSDLWKALISKRVANSAKVPKSRFNIDAHLHKDSERPGSFNVPGGYFLDETPECFDPTFFNMTPIEAMWLDPQQRRILEAAFEAIESAGLAIEDISGTNVGVWVGSFTADYQQMNFKDPDFRHSYSATGVDIGIISNRINNLFDLKGPSSTINTACSSSVYALHNACNALRARDCDAALVCGVNLILTVDQHMNTAKLGVLSPTNTCHTFDAVADGYGRGEGAGALYIKRLTDALQDEDTIRAVIRSSAVNTNGKVPGYGITFPNALGQEAVVRAAYKRGGLDPNKTAYFECHGTGTPVGDPVEARAASRAMNDTRDPNKPLLIGAVKPNVGHSEAASGIFAVIKAALMVEKGLIPGVAGLQTVNPEIPEAELGLKINRDLISWPTEFESRRASVSSFGYGGTNGHVILENVEALVPNYHHGREKTPSDNPAATRPLLLTVSAHDQITLERNIRANLAVAENYSLLDLAYTLNMRRSKLPQRAFAIATEDGSIPLEEGAFVFGTGKKAVKNLAFVFTGQGAQWASVGTEAIKVFPVFRDTIRRLDNVLRKVEHPPTFSIEEQLTAPAEVSKINDPNIAQPTLVAVQIAIVDLLASWGVYPTAVIGHSAGEHAASYAAGLYSAPETIISGYYRGFCLERHAPSGGSMLAVGKGASEVGVDLEQLPSDLVLACENSSKSVTLSGPAETIHAAEAFFKEKGVFARELRTGMAYHSSHMQSTADHMAHYIDAGVQRLDDVDLRWRQPRSVMVSTVTNKELTPEDIKGAYWASNLRSRVLFDTGLATLLKLTAIGEIQGLLEVGPHSALGGPIKQILETSGSSEVAYFSTVVRTEGNSALSLLRSAGRLFNSQYPVNLSAMNGTETPSSPDEVAILKAAQVLKPQPLVDLPPYQWNYEKTFWAEPRLSAEYRQLTHPRHDILGRRILGLSDNSISWRNILRLRDVPWLADHKLGGSIMFPAAGHMAVAIEALRQRMELSGTAVAGVTLRNVELTKALVIPEGDVGVEIQVRLISTSRAEEGNTFDFAVESYTDGVWVVHSTGVVAPMAEGHIAPTSAAINPVNTKNLTRLQTGRVWNDTFTRVGFEYRGSFAALDCVRTHEQHAPQAIGQIPIMTASGVMEDESRYIIHPAAVDAVLQLVIIAIHQGLYQEMPWGVIPVRFEEVDFYFPSESEAGSKGLSTAWLPSRGPRDRKFVSNAILESEAGNILLHIKGLHTVAYDAALPPKTEDALAPMPYFGNTWNADYTLSSLDDIFSRELKDGSVTRALPGLVQIINHKTPVDSVLLVHSSAPIVSDILVHLGIASSITIGTSDVIPAELEALVNLHSLKTVKVPEDASELVSLGLSELNLAVIAGEQSKKLIQKEWLAKFKDTLAAGGKAILVVDHGDLSGARSKIHQAGFVGQEVSFVDKTLMLLSVPAVYTNGHAPPRVTLAYSALHSPRPDALLAQLREQYEGIEVKTLEELDVANSDKVIIYNPTALPTECANAAMAHARHQRGPLPGGGDRNGSLANTVRRAEAIASPHTRCGRG